MRDRGKLKIHYIRDPWIFSNINLLTITNSPIKAFRQKILTFDNTLLSPRPVVLTFNVQERTLREVKGFKKFNPEAIQTLKNSLSLFN